MTLCVQECVKLLRCFAIKQCVGIGNFTLFRVALIQTQSPFTIKGDARVDGQISLGKVQSEPKNQTGKVVHIIPFLLQMAHLARGSYEIRNELFLLQIAPKKGS